MFETASFAKVIQLAKVGTKFCCLVPQIANPQIPGFIRNPQISVTCVSPQISKCKNFLRCAILLAFCKSAHFLPWDGEEKIILLKNSSFFGPYMAKPPQIGRLFVRLNFFKFYIKYEIELSIHSLKIIR